MCDTVTTPRALRGRGAIEMKPLRCISECIQTKKSSTTSRQRSHTRNLKHGISNMESQTRNHASTRNHVGDVTQGITPTQGITSKTSHFYSPMSANGARGVTNPKRTYNVGDVTQGISNMESRRRRHTSIAPCLPKAHMG